jgi:hypothetical protein
MVKRGTIVGVQLRVQLASVPVTAATWEDYDTLRRRYSSAPIWEGSKSQEGGNVTPATYSAIYSSEDFS